MQLIQDWQQAYYLKEGLLIKQQAELKLAEL
jgi:hypothetical protein